MHGQQYIKNNAIIFSLPNAITPTSQSNTCESFILSGSQLNDTF